MNYGEGESPGRPDDSASSDPAANTVRQESTSKYNDLNGKAIVGGLLTQIRLVPLFGMMCE